MVVIVTVIIKVPPTNSAVFLLRARARLRPLSSHSPRCWDGQGQPCALFPASTPLVPATPLPGVQREPLPEVQRHWHRGAPQVQRLLSPLEVPAEGRVQRLQGQTSRGDASDQALGSPFHGDRPAPMALQPLTGHSEACRPSAQGGRGLPWCPSLPQGQVVPEVPEAPADRSTLVSPYPRAAFPLPASSRPEADIPERQEDPGLQAPPELRKGTLVYTCPSQPAPLADLAWGGVPDSSKLRRAPQGSERRGSMPRSPTEASLRLLHTLSQSYNPECLGEGRALWFSG